MLLAVSVLLIGSQWLGSSVENTAETLGLRFTVATPSYYFQRTGCYGGGRFVAFFSSSGHLECAPATTRGDGLPHSTG
jgi:hypothetical protein